MEWKSKARYVGLTQCEAGVCDTVCHFNTGNSATIKIYEEMGVNPGIYMYNGCDSMNKTRLLNAARKETRKAKSLCQMLRGNRKYKMDKAQDLEGETYATGSV